jgi:hypothetical protein
VAIAQARTLALPTAAMVAVVAGSNVAVQYPINDWLTWGAPARLAQPLIRSGLNRVASS